MTAMTLIRAGVSAGGLWTPANLTYPGFWLDASDASTITHTSNSVSQWNDKSGNDYHFTQATSANRPTWNGTDAITSDGSNDVMKTSTILMSDISPTNPVGIFAAVISYTSGVIYFKWENVDWTTRIGMEGASRVDWPNDSGGQLTGWSTSLSSSPQVLMIRRTATNIYVKINGAQVATKANSSTFSSFSSVGSQFSIFANIGDNFHSVSSYKGLVFCGDSDATTAEKLEGYLAWKYGLEGSLDSGHPYKSAAPTL